MKIVGSNWNLVAYPVVTPEFVYTIEADGTKKEEVLDVIACAIHAAGRRTVRAGLESAYRMVSDAAANLAEMDGRYEFSDVVTSLEDGRFTISPGAYESAGGLRREVLLLEVGDGEGSFVLNRGGIIYLDSPGVDWGRWGQIGSFLGGYLLAHPAAPDRRNVEAVAAAIRRGPPSF